MAECLNEERSGVNDAGSIDLSQVGIEISSTLMLQMFGLGVAEQICVDRKSVDFQVMSTTERSSHHPSSLSTGS